MTGAKARAQELEAALTRAQEGRAITGESLTKFISGASVELGYFGKLRYDRQGFAELDIAIRHAFRLPSGRMDTDIIIARNAFIFDPEGDGGYTAGGVADYLAELEATATRVREALQPFTAPV